MVALLLLLVALLLGGFATVEESGDSPVDTAGGEDVPSVILLSDAGEQAGVQGSACVNGPSSSMCIDSAGPVEPEVLSVVRPGERFRIVIAVEGHVEGTVTVRELGCDEKIASLRLRGAAQGWNADFDPGAYELEVFARFDGDELSGDTTVAFGLLVDRSAAPEIVANPRPGAGCPGP